MDMLLGYCADVEFEDLDDPIFRGDRNSIARVKDESIFVMDELLYGYHYEPIDDNEHLEKVPYTEEEFLDVWREYVKGQKESGTRKQKLKEPFRGWEDVEGVMHRLENIKQREPELFYELFSSDFVSYFLAEIADGLNDLLDKRKVKKLASWVQAHKGKELTPDSCWKILLERSQLGIRGGIFDSSMLYSKVWRNCCQKPLYVSCKNPRQKGIYDHAVMSAWVEGIDYIEQLVEFCDGIIDNESDKDTKVLERILEEDDTELLYKVLKKNVINKQQAKEGMEYVIDAQKSHLVPMFMLKVMGEWG